MNDENFRGDEVGPWTAIKLEILRKYAPPWARIINKKPRLRRIYIDGFAGAGEHRRKDTGEVIAGSPKIALAVDPPFHEFHFVDMSSDKTEALQKLSEGRRDVFIHSGDANQVLIESIFPTCRYEDYKRALCLLDPYGLHVRWEVLEAAAKTRAIEVVYHLSVMDINRNVRRSSPDRIPPEFAGRMNAVWGDNSWRDAVFAKSKDLFGDTEELRDYDDLKDAFRDRLKTVAKFGFVEEPLLLKNSTNAPLYWLFFAGPNPTGAKIVKEIFDKYR